MTRAPFPTSHRPRPGRQQGAAVVTALLMVTLAVVVVSGMLWRQQVQIRSIENQMHYILEVLKLLSGSHAETIEVRADVYDAYRAKVDAAHEKMVWTHRGADNWYRNSRGRIVAITPWRNDDFWRMTRKADPADYLLDRATAIAEPAAQEASAG